MRHLLTIAALAAATSAQASTYGPGCGGTTLTMTTPRIGHACIAIVRVDPLRSAKGYIGIGWTPIQVRIGGSLSSPCNLLVDPRILIPVIPDDPTLPGADVNLMVIPRNPAFVGIEFRAQAMAGPTVSNAVRAVIQR